MTRRPRPLDPEQAETLALGALQFLAADMTRLGRFLALTGMGPAELRAGAADPAVLVAVLDHLMSDESLLLVYSAETSIAPDRVAEARYVLGGAPETD